MNEEIIQIIYSLSLLIFFTIINYVIIDFLLKKYIKNKKEIITCTSLETHHFINNKCKYCNKTLSEIMNKDKNNIEKNIKFSNKKIKEDYDKIHTLDEV
jgi:hypothetical protein